MNMLPFWLPDRRRRRSSTMHVKNSAANSRAPTTAPMTMPAIWPPVKPVWLVLAPDEKLADGVGVVKVTVGVIVGKTTPAHRDWISEL